MMGWLAFPMALLRAVITWIVARNAVRMERAKVRAEKAEGYIKTRKEIDHATDEHFGDDPAAARRFLLERSRADTP